MEPSGSQGTVDVNTAKKNLPYYLIKTIFYSSFFVLFCFNMSIGHLILPNCFMFRLFENPFYPSTMLMFFMTPVVFIVFVIITIKLFVVVVLDKKDENDNAMLRRNLKINVLLICIVIFPPRLLGSAFEKYALYKLTSQYERVVNALDVFKSEKGQYPSELDQLVPIYIKEIPDIDIAECDGGCSYNYKNELFKPFFENVEHDYELSIELPRFRHPPTELFYRPSETSTITINDDFFIIIA